MVSACDAAVRWVVAILYQGSMMQFSVLIRAMTCVAVILRSYDAKTGREEHMRVQETLEQAMQSWHCKARRSLVTSVLS